MMIPDSSTGGKVSEGAFHGFLFRFTDEKKSASLWPTLGVFLCGAVTVMLWFVREAGDRTFFLNFFGELNSWLWIALHGRLIAGLLLLCVGCMGFFVIHRRIYFVEALSLYAAGGWVIVNDLFAIPGLHAFNRSIDVDGVLQEFSILWLLIGIVQIGAAFLFLNRYRDRS